MLNFLKRLANISNFAAFRKVCNFLKRLQDANRTFRKFGPQSGALQDIFKFLPADIQIALFSATLPPEILKMTSHFMRDPAKILVKAENLTLEGINQYYIAVE